jgi:type II secretory pathway component PulJ
MNRRSGYTLVEVILAMTFGMILLGCGVRLLILVFRLERAEVARLSDERSQDRLARRFRDDVARAMAFGPAKGRHLSELELALPSGSRVNYAIEKEALVRIEARADKSTGREVYSIPKTWEPRFEFEKRGETQWVLLRWTRADGSGQPQWREPVPVEAALDRFGRGVTRENDDNAS